MDENFEMKFKFNFTNIFLYLFRFVFGCIDTTRKPRKGEQNEKGEKMRILATSLTNRCLGLIV